MDYNDHFQSLENVAEDAVLKKWAVQETSDKERVVGSKKRKPISQAAGNADSEIQEIPGSWGLTRSRNLNSSSNRSQSTQAVVGIASHKAH